MAVLQVKNIEKHFGATRVLEDISFELEQGQALAIIGSSGSGKTTLLRCLNFLETPDQGQILVQDKVLFDAADPSTQRESEIRKKRHSSRLFVRCLGRLSRVFLSECLLVPLCYPSGLKKILAATRYY